MSDLDQLRGILGLVSIESRLNHIEEITLDQRDVVVMGLARRICDLERQAHGHTRHENPTYTEAKTLELIVKLEERIEVLERTAVKRDMARGMDYEQVHPDEMARLRRIEQAARALVDSRYVSEGDRSIIPSPAIRRLREALGDA